ncbi:MAG: hypothetical protein H0U23_15220 [Blastocatellia bacterium]|nr:hypothetical protein [Blastocatellia bacterium]
MSSLDAELEKLYRDNWDRLSAGIPRGCGMSNPLLGTVPGGYEAAPVRLLVIGRETHGWCEGWDAEFSGDRVAGLRLRYASFERGKRYRKTPFFQAATELQRLLNPASDPFDFMWLNLFICDEKKGLPKGPNAESLRRISLLREEIFILEPDAVVFFTGPATMNTIKHPHYFPDAEFRPRSPKWSQLVAAGLRKRQRLPITRNTCV